MISKIETIFAFGKCFKILSDLDLHKVIFVIKATAIKKCTVDCTSLELIRLMSMPKTNQLLLNHAILR